MEDNNEYDVIKDFLKENPEVSKRYYQYKKVVEEDKKKEELIEEYLKICRNSDISWLNYYVTEGHISELEAFKEMDDLSKEEMIKAMESHINAYNFLARFYNDKLSKGEYNEE